jgi:putative ABC transport system permease protein
VTAVLDRPSAPVTPPSVPRHGRLRTWLGQWRVALRLARRDAWRSKGRSLLVLLIVGLPVLIVSGVILWGYQSIAANQPRAYAELRLQGGADAVVAPQIAPVEQSLYGDVTNTLTGPAPTEATIRAALPEGSRLVAMPDQTRELILENGDWGVTGGFVSSEMSDPLLRGYWRNLEGTFPKARGQVLLDASLARRLHAGLGTTITVSGTGDQRSLSRELLVVGLADPNPMFWSTGVVWPGDLPVVRDAGPTTTLPPFYLVDSPAPITWDVVRQVNKAGAFVTSRAVVDDPPTFCSSSEICLDDGPAPGQEPGMVSSPTSPDAAREAALGGVVIVLVILQIALLAGPAFAVQLRRRQRELGLVGASGGDAKVLRRTVLASGVVLGVAASVGGAVLAWAAIAVMTKNESLLALFSYPGIPPLPPFPPELFGVMAVGIVASIAAAMVPAVVAGRGDVVDTLRGRRPLPALRRSLPLVGLATGGLGLLVMVYGVLQLDAVILGVGVVLGELGIVLLMPWIIVQTGRFGGRLPLAGRLAVRDSGRHRMRTAAAACAVAAAAAAAVGVSAAYGATATYATSTDVATLPDVSVVYLPLEQYDEMGQPVPVDADKVVAETRAVVRAADPDARTALLRDVAPAGRPQSVQAGAAYISCGPADAGILSDPSQIPCYGRQPQTFLPSSSSVVEVSPDDLPLILGPAAPLDEARAALEEGKAVVLQPNGVVDGKVTLTASWSDPETGAMSAAQSVDVPAIEVLRGTLPATVLVSSQTLARPDVAKVLGPGTSGLMLAQPSEADSGDRPTFVERVNLEMARSELGAGVSESLAQTDMTLIVLLAGVGATALLALLAGLMVTALALADGRADHATLQAVGAAPRVRRAVAAATAGYVAGLGCIVGAASGLVGSYVLLPLLTDGRGFGAQNTWSIPWPMVGLIVVAVPLITAGVAWLTTRSRVELTRRLDS